MSININIRNKKLVVIGIIIPSIIVVLFLLFFNADLSFKSKTKKVKDISGPLLPSLSVTKIENDIIPEGFPANILLEKDGVILENKSITSQDKPGIIQYTRKFISKKNLDENYVLYKNFLEKNNWNIVSLDKKDSLGSLIAVDSNNTQLMITISKNSINGNVIVDLTVVKKI